MGSKLKGGEVIELVGDLGSGKTTFVKGLAKGLGSTDHIHSPSFTLSNEYKAGELTINHFDFHRLNEPGIMRDELAEVLTAPKAVVVVEWPDIVEDVLPSKRLSIQLQPISEQGRKVTINFDQTLSYLIPN